MNPETVHTPAGTEIVLRSCEGMDELEGCVRLQMETWGYDAMDVVPRKLFVVAQRVGGQVLGAFAGQELIGFAFSLPGMKRAERTGQRPAAYLHSHMLAVVLRHRNEGIGRRLKLYQREEALERGISLVEWTFDPLEIKNGFLNIHRLGAVVRSYTPDFYGVSSSRLQAGLPTDRLHAEWWIESERVKAILRGAPPPPLEIQETIVVPRAVSEWKASPGSVFRALSVQAEIRRRFQDAFGRGLAVVGFRADAEGNGSFELTSQQALGVL